MLQVHCDNTGYNLRSPRDSIRLAVKDTPQEGKTRDDHAVSVSITTKQAHGDTFYFTYDLHRHVQNVKKTDLDNAIIYPV
jgi:hypothetical protein